MIGWSLLIARGLQQEDPNKAPPLPFKRPQVTLIRHPKASHRGAIGCGNRGLILSLPSLLSRVAGRAEAFQRQLAEVGAVQQLERKS